MRNNCRRAVSTAVASLAVVVALIAGLGSGLIAPAVTNYLVKTGTVTSTVSQVFATTLTQMTIQTQEETTTKTNTLRSAVSVTTTQTSTTTETTTIYPDSQNSTVGDCDFPATDSPTCIAIPGTTVTLTTTITVYSDNITTGPGFSTITITVFNDSSGQCCVNLMPYNAPVDIVICPVSSVPPSQVGCATGGPTIYTGGDAVITKPTGSTWFIGVLPEQLSNFTGWPAPCFNIDQEWFPATAGANLNITDGLGC